MFLVIDQYVPYMIFAAVLLGVFYTIRQLRLAKEEPNHENGETEGLSLNNSKSRQFAECMQEYRERKLLKPVESNQALFLSMFEYLADYHVAGEEVIPPGKYTSGKSELVGCTLVDYFVEVIEEEIQDFDKVLHKWKSWEKTRNVLLNRDATHYAFVHIIGAPNGKLKNTLGLFMVKM